MLLITLFTMLLFAAVAYFLMPKPPEPVSVKRTGRHSAVELVVGKDCCTKARLLAGSRQLSAQAPVLPIDGCDRQCHCSYRQHADRRSVNRRRMDDGLSEEFIYAGMQNRRRNRRTG